MWFQQFILKKLPYVGVCVYIYIFINKWLEDFNISKLSHEQTSVVSSWVFHWSVGVASLVQDASAEMSSANLRVLKEIEARKGRGRGCVGTGKDRNLGEFHG